MLLEWIGQSKAWNAAPSMEHAMLEPRWNLGSESEVNVSSVNLSVEM